MRLPDRRLDGLSVHAIGFARPMRRLVRPCFAWSATRLKDRMMRAVLRGQQPDLFSVSLYVVRFPASFVEIICGSARMAESSPGITMIYMTLGRES